MPLRMELRGHPFRKEFRDPWKHAGAAAGIAATALGGALLSNFLGPPKTFFLIALGMVVWIIAGWLLGGWRPLLAGLAVLTAALCASEGSYPLAFVFACLAFVFMFADITPRDADVHSKGVG